MVDIGVGYEQCGPASCRDCGAYQDMTGDWYRGGCDENCPSEGKCATHDVRLRPRL